MNIQVTLPDDALDAWNHALNGYNNASPVHLDLPAYVNDIVVGAQTNANVSAFNSYQIQQLVPLGERYSAAPESVKLQIDALLAPV